MITPYYSMWDRILEAIQSFPCHRKINVTMNKIVLFSSLIDNIADIQFHFRRLSILCLGR